jgi:hypothetical protein
MKYVLAAFALVAFAAYLRGTRHYFYGPWRCMPVMRTALAHVEEQRRVRGENYRIVHETIRPGTKVIAMTEEYGYPLEMEAWLRVVFWPPHHDIAIMEKAGVISAEPTRESPVAKLLRDAWRQVVFWRSHHDAVTQREGGVAVGFTHDTQLAKLIADGCEFAVISDFVEFGKQPELKVALQKHGRLIVNQPQLLIYDLRPSR